MSGGEPKGARLLALARQELLEAVLPALSGDARYRARLIANAMKIAVQELESAAAMTEATAVDLAAFAQSAEIPTAAGGDGSADPETALRDALRGGSLDASEDLHNLLAVLNRRRRDVLG
ncbi:MAG: DUF6285 domain-containing protein [Kiloniellaceae bacterium]